MRTNSFLTGIAAGIAVTALTSAAIGITMSNPRAKRTFQRSANRAMNKMNDAAHNISDMMD